MLLLAPKAKVANKPPLASQVADDQGYANIGYHNSTMLTPRIDELAHEGVILESYCALAASVPRRGPAPQGHLSHESRRTDVQPICSPTRSSLMTGRYTYRLGTQATVIRAE